MILLYKISDWHKITAEKDGACYSVFDCVKSVFGSKWEKITLKQGLTHKQIQEIKKIYKNM